MGLTPKIAVMFFDPLVSSNRQLAGLTQIVFDIQSGFRVSTARTFVE